VRACRYAALKVGQTRGTTAVSPCSLASLVHTRMRALRAASSAAAHAVEFLVEIFVDQHRVDHRYAVASASAPTVRVERDILGARAARAAQVEEVACREGLFLEGTAATCANRWCGRSRKFMPLSRAAEAHG